MRATLPAIKKYFYQRETMTITANDSAELRERLMSLGYSYNQRIRMYGEEFDLASNPTPHEDGFAIEAISRKSGALRRLRIPLSVLHMITKDLTRTKIAEDDL